MAPAPPTSPARTATADPTSLLPSQVALVLPSVDQVGQIADLQYWGTGQAGSTVYHVVMTASANASYTATLVEDTIGAVFVGLSRTISPTADPTAVATTAAPLPVETVKAGISCGYQYGATGFCVGFEALAGYSTSTYFTGQSVLFPSTTISPQAGVVSSRLASQYAATATNTNVATGPGSLLGKGHQSSAAKSAQTSVLQRALCISIAATSLLLILVHV